MWRRSGLGAAAVAAALATAAACTSAPEHPTSAVQLAVEAADTPLDQARALVTWVCEENAPKRTEGTETRDVPAGTWPDSGVTKITYKMVVMPVLEYRAKPAGSTCTGREARVTRWEVAIVATAYDAQNKMVMAAVHGIPITGGKVERPLALWATVGGETFAVYQGESAERDAWLLKNAQTMVEVINKVSAGPAPAPCGEEDETCEAPPPAVPDEPMPPPVPGEEPLPPMPPAPEEPTPLPEEPTPLPEEPTPMPPMESPAEPMPEEPTPPPPMESPAEPMPEEPTPLPEEPAPMPEEPTPLPPMESPAEPLPAPSSPSTVAGLTVAGLTVAESYVFLAPPLCKEEEDALTLATINYALIVINGKAQDSDLVWLAAYALYHYTCLNGPQQVYQLLKVILPAVNLALPRPPIAGGNPIAPLRPPPPIPPKAPAPLPNPNPAPAPEVAPAPREVLAVPASPLDLSIARAHQNILTAPGLNNAVRKMSLCNATGAINRSVDLLFTVQCSNFFNPPPAGFEEVITVTPTLAAKGQAGDCVALFEQIEPRFASPPNQNCIVTRVAMQTPLAVNLYKITRAGDTFTLAHAAN